jgi:hypothetical protein
MRIGTAKIAPPPPVRPSEKPTKAPSTMVKIAVVSIGVYSVSGRGE